MLARTGQRVCHRYPGLRILLGFRRCGICRKRTGTWRCVREVFIALKGLMFSEGLAMQRTCLSGIVRAGRSV